MIGAVFLLRPLAVMVGRVPKVRVMQVDLVLGFISIHGAVMDAMHTGRQAAAAAQEGRLLLL